ncbi:MAG TPA: response regulator, partial [Bacteroides sp.]|nr:response regulator [Bacteroides sp.]
MLDCLNSKYSVCSSMVRCLRWIAILCFAYSCQPADQAEHQENRQPQDPMIPVHMTIRVHTGHKDTITRDRLNIYGVKAGKPDTIPVNKPKTVYTDDLWKIEPDTTKLRRIRPGMHGLPHPRVYHVPEPTKKSFTEQLISGNYTVQHGDTLFAPVITRAGQPEAIPAMPMRMKDQAGFNVRYISTEQGLLDPEIISMFQDSRGYLWFGSSSSGVCVYDGMTLKYFTTREGLPDAQVRCMLEDRSGNIWLGTPQGLVKYDGRYFTHYMIAECIDVRSLFETKQGTLWIGTGAGMMEVNGADWTVYGQREGLMNHEITGITKDDQGNIWTSEKEGIYKFDGTKFTFYRSHQDLVGSDFSSAFKDSRGDLWFTSDGGIRKYDGTAFALIPSRSNVFPGWPDILSFIHTSSVAEDSGGKIWIATTRGGLNMHDGKSFIHYKAEHGFNNYLIKVLIDENNNPWLGTAGNGVMQFQPNSFRYFSQLEEPGAGAVRSVLEDDEGRIRIATDGGGLYTCDGEHFFVMRAEQGLITDGIYGMIRDRDGNIWLNYRWSLDKLDGDSVINYELFHWEQGKLMTISECIFADKQGNIWIGTEKDGLKKLAHDSFIPVSLKIELPGGSNKVTGQGFISCILEDKKGNLWLGTFDMGLLKYDGESIIQYYHEDPSDPVVIYSIYEDTPGNLWMGTLNHGIIRYDGRSFAALTEKQGLCNNHVTSIIEDRSGKLWIGTHNGLSLISPKKEGAWDITNFGASYGLKNVSFNPNSVCLDSRDRLWWGTGHILTMLDLNNFQISTPPPKVQLTDIRLNNEFIDFGRLMDSDTGSRFKNVYYSDAAPFFNYPIDLELPHNLNHLTFKYSAIYWTAPGSVRFQYILQGLEDDWSMMTSDNQADYRNISPGSYVFKVRAFGRDGKVSNQVEYPFRIRRPWWFRWWAFTLYGISVVLLMWYIVLFILSRERIKAGMKLKQVEVEKMQELDQMKSRFFANISHEFRTPLTLILGPVENMLRRKDKEDASHKEELGIIHRNARRLQQLINQLLDISKLETGKVRLEVSEGNLSEFIRRIVLSFLSLAESRSINYIYDLPETPPQVYFDRDKVEKIITNLLSNAFKFTPAGGKIRIRMKYEPGVPEMSGGSETPGYAVISVSDTGKGIPGDQLERIFDRFYQVSSSDSRLYEGTGIGLSLTRELVDICRGEIRVESEPGKGSVFTVTLPVSGEKFHEDEIVEPADEMQKVDEIEPEVITEAITGEIEPGKDHPAETRSEKQVILVVEDNADLRKYISSNLEDQYRLKEAENGLTGLEAAIETIPDLIITDLMMPEMDGIELCNRIRKDQRINHIPVVMLTAKADKASKLEGLETGADDYLVKPFDVDELRVRVKNLIQQRKSLRKKYQDEFVESDPFTTKIHGLENEFLSKVVDCIQKHMEEHEFGVEQL